MANKMTSRQALGAELQRLRQRLEEAEDTLHAIRHGEVDALVVTGPKGDSVFTLIGAEQPYRVLVEAMSEGALTLSVHGAILYSNTRFAEFLTIPLERVIGAPLYSFITPGDQPQVRQLVEQAGDTTSRKKVSLLGSEGRMVPVQLSARRADINSV